MKRDIGNGTCAYFGALIVKRVLKVSFLVVQVIIFDRVLFLQGELYSVLKFIIIIQLQRCN
jgi:hypothetical protein